MWNNSAIRGALRFMHVCVIITLGIAGVAAQESEQDQEGEAVDSVVEQSRDVLRYGIDSEVSDLLDRLADQSEDRLDEEILTRFTESHSTDLRVKILEFFQDRDVAIAGDATRELLLSEEQLDNDLLRVAVRYLSRVVHDDSPELLGRYKEIAMDEDLIAGSIAIEAIGMHGGEEAANTLMELYDELTAVQLRGAVIRALGEADATEAVPLLTGIATDPFEEANLREYAATSLGQIGSPDSLEPLIGLLSSEDGVLRAYAMSGVGYYDDDRAIQALTEGLRDSFWRVRVAALEGLAKEDGEAALDAIAYKARRDPENPVRQAALQTLASLDSTGAYDVLREIVLDPRRPDADRMTAVTLLVEHDLSDSLETVQTVMDKEWDVENSRLLDATAKALVSTTSNKLGPVYERLLSHPNYIMRIYAIRGIGRSGLSELGDRVREIAENSSIPIVRSNALATLDLLGIERPEVEE